MFVVIERDNTENFSGYSIYSENFIFLGNAFDEDGIFRLIKKWCRKARGNKNALRAVLKKYRGEGSTYPKFQEYVSEMWEEKYADMWEEKIEGFINSAMDELKVRVRKPILKSGKKSAKVSLKPKKKLGLKVRK